MFVENEYRVKLSDINRENKATNKAILSYLEDVGGKHSDIAGYGILDIPYTHLSWIILDWKLQILRRPNYAENIRVVTWSKEAIKCYAYRDFEIYDEQGKLIVKAASRWILVDTQKGKIIRLDEKLINKYEPESKKAAFEEEEFFKMKQPEKYQFETEYKVRKSDIDVNNHMHNINYVDLANEALPEKIYNEEKLENIRISYKKEIKLGEIVKCQYSFIDGKHIVTVKSFDEKLIHAFIELS